MCAEEDGGFVWKWRVMMRSLRLLYIKVLSTVVVS